MRLWSIHPCYLDAKGLVALWREGLLAQKVLTGETRGYKHHPQLIRFNSTKNPNGAISTYLRAVVKEADNRGYQFDRGKIIPGRYNFKIPVTSGQVEYEFNHLLSKLHTRDPDRFAEIKEATHIQLHPSFDKVRGNIEDWEVQ